MQAYPKCPKCNPEFDDGFTPGASLTASRLRSRRYRARPLCNRWSMFDLKSTRVAE